jgi:hypothetical protein
LPKLTDQVGGADEAGFSICFCVIIVVRHRKPGQLNRARYPLAI